jgi:MFS family permease
MLLMVSRTGVAETKTPATEKFALDLLRVRPLAGAIVIGLAMFLMIGTFDSLWAVVMDDLDAPTWMANVGITIFALPLIIFGPLGGKLAQRYGPFRLASLGLVVAACFMSAYGLLPAAWMLLFAGLFHSLSDGFTITGSGVAVGIVGPPDRQAAAQGLLGGLQTLMGGLAATTAGWSYEHLGRGATFTGCGLLMVALVGLGSWLAGPSWHSRPDPVDAAVVGQPVPA